MPTYRIDQGDDETIHISVKSPAQSDAPDPSAWSSADTSTWGPLNITGCKLWFWIRPNDVGAPPVITKTTDAGEGITVVDAVQGLADVEIGHAETAALDDALINKTLRLELQIESVTGRITTLRRATITIIRDRLVA